MMNERQLRHGTGRKCVECRLKEVGLLNSVWISVRDGIPYVLLPAVNSAQNSARRERGKAEDFASFVENTSVYCNAGSPPTANGLQPAPVPL